MKKGRIPKGIKGLEVALERILPLDECVPLHQHPRKEGRRRGGAADKLVQREMKGAMRKGGDFVGDGEGMQ